jgi:tellurite resistance protein TerC
MLMGLLGVIAESWFWGVFGVLIVVFLVLDLGVLNKNPHKVSTRSALWQSTFWVSLALGFGVLIAYSFPATEKLTSYDAALLYLTAYVSEYALSVDNIFVIILILRYFQIDDVYYHKILFWGIMGAMIMRGIFILLGAKLVQQFEFVLYIFGAFLLYSGFKMFFKNDDEEFDPDSNKLFKLVRKYFRFTHTQGGGKFIVVDPQTGKRMFTKLFLALLLIEITDLIFAVDSVPAAFGITREPVLLYTSNIFAVLGLRAMFFLLAGVLDKFYLLQRGLSLVLIFIGVKMVLEISDNILGKDYEFHLSAKWSLGIILALLMGSIVLSLLFPKKKVTQSLSEQPADNDDIINSSNGSSVSVTSEMEESQTA